MIRAIIFDFDGTIFDTETPRFQSWCEIYEDHGCTLTASAWSAGIGYGADQDRFDPYRHLAEQVGRPINRDEISTRRRARYSELVQTQAALPGIESYVRDAWSSGLKLGIASSAPRDWVERHLHHLGMLSTFDCIRCLGDVARSKPYPDLYLAVLDALAVVPGEAIAIEDSPIGALAARRAGIFCIVVPSAMTSDLPFDNPDRRLASLADVALQTLLAQIGPG